MTDRKFQSNLQVYTLEVTIPTTTPIPLVSVTEVRLLIRSHEGADTLVDEAISGYTLSAPSSLPQVRPSHGRSRWTLRSLRESMRQRYGSIPILGER